MEQQIVVKLEDQTNREILLYYVDENGQHQEGVITTIENIENSTLPLEDNPFIIGNLGDLVGEVPLEAKVEVDHLIEWMDDDIRRLLIFYNDNKPSFISGATQKKHLWAVACKTMLIGKNQELCEAKLMELKNKYIELREYIEKGLNVKWPFFDLCHQAFHDDPAVKHAVNLAVKQNEIRTVNVLKQEIIKLPNQDIIKHESLKQDKTPKAVDEKVIEMLNLYLKYKQNFLKEYWRKDLWEKIAAEMGEQDAEYLQRRFLNYKQHYIKLLLIKKETGNCPNWPYMEFFNKIFGDDVSFHKKYLCSEPIINDQEIKKEEWELSEKMVLVKYVYDSFHEFEDPTIPNQFLWHEIGRLLDKSPDCCKTKYKELRKEHVDKYLTGEYNLHKRVPISIIFDCLIAKEVKRRNSLEDVPLTDSETDELLQFFCNNAELYKDSVCHYVCLEVISKKINKEISSCRNKWAELLKVYRCILAEKKENPDMQIEWKYIDMFDRIFDYGMDSKLFEDFDYGGQLNNVASGVEKQAPTNTETEENQTSPRTDPKTTKILEYYLKSKEKFQINRNKLSLWEPLAKEFKIPTTQCSHQLRILKQKYMEQIQKEIENPKCGITWPYYTLCKKVFGYRTIKNKLKQGDPEEWIQNEIKQLITYFFKHYHEISNNIEDLTKWTPLANELGRSTKSCKDKFVELRKCYRKLKTMRSRNPEVKITWCYFNMFDRFYSVMKDGDEGMEIEVLDEEQLEERTDVVEDDYCIIILPEGQELTDLSNAQIINGPDNKDNIIIKQKEKWTKKSKKNLLIHYINYIRLNRNKVINKKQMWKQISLKFKNKTPINCRTMFTKMLNCFKNADEITKNNSPFTYLLDKVVKLKPKFLEKQKSFKDVQLSTDKVMLALQYYLDNIEDFLNPKFEKKFLWNELANHVSEPVNKVFNKINYLKQAFNIETDEINGEKTVYADILKQIITKEVAINTFFEMTTQTEHKDTNDDWNDEETEVLLNWYLNNIDKFKNPKYNRSYLWKEAANVLNKHPTVCSKKMMEIRTVYKKLVKENSTELISWKFLELCQKIYGTGKKVENDIDQMIVNT